MKNYSELRNELAIAHHKAMAELCASKGIAEPLMACINRLEREYQNRILELDKHYPKARKEQLIFELTKSLIGAQVAGSVSDVIAKAENLAKKILED